MYGAGFSSGCIGSERDPQKHARMKRTLATAFSTKALIAQEKIVQSQVDRFIDKLGKLGAGRNGLNMTDWFEMIAFDILGEMAFGESFHSVEDNKPHFWSQLIEKHLFYVTVVDNLRRFPLLRRIGQIVLPAFTVSVRDKHTGYSRAKVQEYAHSQSRQSTYEACSDLN